MGVLRTNVELTAQADQLKKEIKQATIVLGDFIDQLENVDEAVKDQETKDAEAKLKDLRDAYKDLADNLDKVRDELDKQKDSADRAESGYKGIIASLNKLSLAFKLSAAAAAAAMVIITKKTYEAGTQFETAISQVRALTGITGQAIEDVKQFALTVSNETGMAATAIAEAVGKVASALPQLMATPAQLQEVTDAVIQLSEAAAATGDAISISDAVDVVSIALESFKLDASKASNVANILGKSVQAGSVPFSGLIQVLKAAGSSANAAGVELTQLVALTQTVGKQIDPAEQGTAFKNFFTILAVGNSNLEKYVRNLKDVNPNVVGFETAIKNLSIAMRDASGALDLTKISSAFGTETQGIVLQLLSSLEKYEGLETTLVQIDDVLNDIITSGQNTAKSMETIGVRLDNMFIKLWEAVLPFKQFLPDITPMLDAIDAALTRVVSTSKSTADALRTILDGITGVNAAAVREANEYAEASNDLSEKIALMREQTGLAIKNEREYLDAIRDGKVVKDISNGQWVIATDRVRRLNAAYEDAIKQFKYVGDVYNSLSTLVLEKQAALAEKEAEIQAARIRDAEEAKQATLQAFNEQLTAQRSALKEQERLIEQSENRLQSIRDKYAARRQGFRIEQYTRELESEIESATFGTEDMSLKSMQIADVVYDRMRLLERNIKRGTIDLSEADAQLNVLLSKSAKASDMDTEALDFIGKKSYDILDALQAVETEAEQATLARQQKLREASEKQLKDTEQALQSFSDVVNGLTAEPRVIDLVLEAEKAKSDIELLNAQLEAFADKLKELESIKAVIDLRTKANVTPVGGEVLLPEYANGGATGNATHAAILHPNEFVVNNKGVNAVGNKFLSDLNKGSINPTANVTQEAGLTRVTMNVYQEGNGRPERLSFYAQMKEAHKLSRLLKKK